MNKSPLHGFRRVEDSPRQAEFHRAPLPHRRLDGAKDYERPHRKADLRKSESAPLRCDGDMSIRHQAQTAAQRRTLHRGHNRLGAARSNCKNLLVNVGARRCFGIKHFIQIHAG